MPPALLEITGLKVHFPTREGLVRAVEGVDLSLRRGTTLGLVGESGCGKSMTARAILRIIPEPGRIVGGKILFFRDPHSDPVDLARLRPTGPEMRAIRGKEIAMIFQEPMASLSPVHTIGHQIMEAIRLHLKVGRSEAFERAVEMLHLVGIPQPSRRIHAYPFQLSGGMRQRAMIAMALACRPAILLADEPTTALDVTVQAQILDLLRRLQQELGMSIVLITHNLGVVASVCHDVSVMYMGRIVESGPVKTVLKRPLHPYTQGLIQSVPILGAGTKRRQLIPIPGAVPGPYVRVQGCPFHPRCPTRIPGTCDRLLPGLVTLSDGVKVRCFLHSDAVEPGIDARSEVSCSGQPV